MKNIIFCFPPLSYYGEEYYFRTQQLVDNLKKDFQIKIIKSIARIGQSKERNFALKKIFIFLINIPFYLNKIGKTDIMLIFPTPLWYFWITIGKLLKKKIVLDHFTTPVYPLEIVNTPLFLKKLFIRFDKFFYRHIDLIITHTNTMKKEIVNFYQINKNKIIVIYSLVDTKLFAPQKITKTQITKLKKYYYLPYDKKILLYHGRFHSSHGLSIIEKMSELSYQQKKNYIFVFVGVKQKKDKNKYFLPHVKFKELYKSLALANLWLGRFSNSFRAQRAASSCMLQAMAMRIPIITFNTYENKSIINNNENGFLTNTLNPQLILNQIDKILKNEELLNKVSFNARETIKRNFSLYKWQKINLALINL